MNRGKGYTYARVYKNARQNKKYRIHIRGTGNVENQKKMFFWRCQCLEDKQPSSLIIAVIIVDR